MSGLTTRILTALVLIPSVLALIWVAPLQPLFSLFVAALAGIAMHEYLRLIAKKGVDAEESVLIPCAVAVVISAFWGNPALVSIIVLGTVFVCVAFHIRGVHHAASRIPAGVFGLVYLGWVPAHLVLLHRLPGSGAAFVTVLLVAVILTDAGAYFFGKSIGKHKFAPVVSPNKTWEGAAGGFVCAILGVLVYACVDHQWNALDWPILFGVFVGAGLSVAAQVGDLLESALKRDAGVKDSGTILPGHGGVLDRCDGFLFAIPVLYYMVTF